MTIVQQLRALVKEAKETGNIVRVHDIRYAAEGLPEVHKDHIKFNPGDFEVWETGPLSGPSKKRSILLFPRVVPLGSINLFEISKGHK